MAEPTRADGYAERSRALLAQAKQELARGHHLQASEKLWAAAAQMVKAVAGRRDWRHDSHRSLFGVVGRLVEETCDSGPQSRLPDREQPAHQLLRELAVLPGRRGQRIDDRGLRPCLDGL